MKYNIVDGHCDTPMELYLRQEDLQDNTCQVSLSRAQTLAGYVQFYAFCTVWLDKRTSFEQHYEAALPILTASWTSMPAASSAAEPKPMRARRLRAANAAHFCPSRARRQSPCDPGKLELAYEQGVRMIAPCWNAPNALTGSIVSGGV